MTDREKVIEALRICRENLSTKSCRKCPYIRGRDGTGTCYPMDAEENEVHLCWQDLVDDAIALLQERESVKPEIYTPDSKTVWTNWYICGICNEPVDPGDNYCRHCGQKMIWGGDEND